MGGFIPMNANLKLDLALYQIKYIIIHVFKNDSFVAVVNQTML